MKSANLLVISKICFLLTTAIYPAFTKNGRLFRHISCLSWQTIQTNITFISYGQKYLQTRKLKLNAKMSYVYSRSFYTPFTNAKVERGFSRMARVKTDFRNQLSRERLSACFRISEEGISITDFNPDPAIELWYNDKVRRLGSSSHKYKKRSKIVGNDIVPELSTLSISDWESDSDNDSSSAD